LTRGISVVIRPTVWEARPTEEKPKQKLLPRFSGESRQLNEPFNVLVYLRNSLFTGVFCCAIDVPLEDAWLMTAMWISAAVGAVLSAVMAMRKQPKRS
jgi:hypothetical protein